MRYIQTYKASKARLIFSNRHSLLGRPACLVCVLLFLACAVPFAQENILLTEHDQYLLEIGDIAMIRGEAIILSLGNKCPNCPRESEIQISLRILGNRFSALVQLDRERLYENGILHLQKDKPEYYATLELGSKSAWFQILFLFQSENQIMVKENLCKVFANISANDLITEVGRELLPLVAVNLDTQNYQPCITKFFEAQKPLFAKLLHARDYVYTSGIDFSCPCCGGHLFYYSAVCYHCNMCVKPFDGKCPYCENAIVAKNVKICNICGQCYQ